MRFLLAFPDTISTSALWVVLDELKLELNRANGLQMEHVPDNRHIIDLEKSIHIDELRRRVAEINPKVSVYHPTTTHLTIPCNTWEDYINMESFRKVHSPRLITRDNGVWVFEVPTQGILKLYTHTLELLGLNATCQTVIL